MSNEKYVTELREIAAREMLIEIMNKLDELDEDDFFGTEGWHHTFGFDE